jgi:hypothetical protein
MSDAEKPENQASKNVPIGASGIMVAVQYWSGDETAALRLARLLADIEPEPRQDATIMLVRRFDTPLSEDAILTMRHVSRKFPVMLCRSKREATGHPAGCNALMGGLMDHLGKLWREGELYRPSVFLAEADGCPLRDDWLNCLIGEHEAAVDRGLSVTGPYMSFLPHINGSMLIHVPFWVDHPSLHVTPPEQGWDIWHRSTFLRAAHRTKLIMNIHHSKKWASHQLGPLGAEHAWITSVKDSSVIDWAEQALVPHAAREMRELRDENSRLRRRPR